jgi:hypothetical protein
VNDEDAVVGEIRHLSQYSLAIFIVEAATMIESNARTTITPLIAIIDSSPWMQGATRSNNIVHLSGPTLQLKHARLVSGIHSVSGIRYHNAARPHQVPGHPQRPALAMHARRRAATHRSTATA